MQIFVNCIYWGEHTFPILMKLNLIFQLCMEIQISL